MPTTRVRKALLGASAGVAMALVMPGSPLGVLSFVALLPLLFIADAGGSFLSFYTGGLVFFLINLRWMFTLASFDALAIPGVLLLFLYLALYFGLFGVILRAIRRRWDSDHALLILFPILFTSFEILRNTYPLALGFSSLYQALYRYPVLIQMAAYLGPWSITAAIAFSNTAFYLAIRRRRVSFAIIGAGAISVLLIFSLLPVSNDGEQVQVSIISSQVPQEEKLDDRNLLPLLDRYTALGQRAAAGNPDLIVFPESILPGYILRDDRLLPHFTSLAKQAHADVLLGTGDYVHGRIYNSVCLISPLGVVVGRYDMVHPVPFGEVIPGRSVLERMGLKSFIDSFLPQEVTPGDSCEPIAGIGTPICFESTFPGISRTLARNGASLLVVVTNDAWFAGSSELPAHFACAVFRAVETRRYLLQAANGGISGVIDQRGSVIVSQEGEGIVSGTVMRLSGESFYSRCGDLPLYLLFAVGILIVGTVEVREKNKGRG